jgi:hypothetical protein
MQSLTSHHVVAQPVEQRHQCGGVGAHLLHRGHRSGRIVTSTIPLERLYAPHTHSEKAAA